MLKLVKNFRIVSLYKIFLNFKNIIENIIYRQVLYFALKYDTLKKQAKNAENKKKMCIPITGDGFANEIRILKRNNDFEDKFYSIIK